MLPMKAITCNIYKLFSLMQFNHQIISNNNLQKVKLKKSDIHCYVAHILLIFRTIRPNRSRAILQNLYTTIFICKKKNNYFRHATLYNVHVLNSCGYLTLNKYYYYYLNIIIYMFSNIWLVD